MRIATAGYNAKGEYEMGDLYNHGEQPITTCTAGYFGCYFHNVLDTKGEPFPKGCNSFLEYWEKNSGQTTPTECQTKCNHQNADGTDADKKDLVGAHVRIDGISCPDDWAWIVPLCRHCNSDDHTWRMALPEGTTFVPIKMSKAHPTAQNPIDAYLYGR